MQSPENEALVGKLAQERGFATEDQVLDCLDMQALIKRHLGHSVPLGAVMLARGYLTVDQVRSLLNAAGVPIERTKRLGSTDLFGRLAVEQGYLKRPDVLACLDVQAAEVKSGKPPRPLGEIIVERGLLTKEKLAELIALQRRAVLGKPAG
jgi:hypothetical protein